MRKLIILLLIAYNAPAQKAVVAADKMNVIYIGYENPITIAASGYLSKDLVLKTNIGTLEKTAISKYIFTICGTTLSQVYFYVYVKKQRTLHLIDSIAYRIRSAPLPLIRIGPLSSGRLQKTVLLAQQVLRSSDDADFADGPYHQVKSFEVELHRQNGDTILLKSASDHITEEMHIAFSDLEVKDWFIIRNAVFYNKCEGLRTAEPTGQISIY